MPPPMSPPPAQHLALPLQVAGGRLVALPQDSPLEVTQSVALLVATRQGERRTNPDYGITDPVFGGVDAAEISDAILEWEPRADPATVDQVVDGIVEHDTVWVEGIISSSVLWPGVADTTTLGGL